MSSLASHAREPFLLFRGWLSESCKACAQSAYRKLMTVGELEVIPDSPNDLPNIVQQHPALMRNGDVGLASPDSREHEPVALAKRLQGTPPTCFRVRRDVVGVSDKDRRSAVRDAECAVQPRRNGDPRQGLQNHEPKRAT